MTLNVNVTQDCIDSGSTCDEATCPIALAIMTDYPEFDRIEVGAETVAFCIDGVHYMGELPIEAAGFISNFDDSNDVQPFVFQFDATVY